jgi:molybdopterin-guanine dinucleotide biosynthesis protein B
VAVIGYKDSGKTRVVEELVRELSNRGYKVGTVKHVGAPDFSIDREGTDTWRHARAGAHKVICVSEKETATIEPRGLNWKELKVRLQGLDFFVLEGFREVKGIAKILVAANEAEVDELLDEFVVATVGARAAGRPSFSFESLQELASVVEKRAFPPLPGLDCKKCGFKTCNELALAIIRGEREWNSCVVVSRKVRVAVDGSDVPLNSFVQELIHNVVNGIVKSLKGTNGKRIKIEVDRNAR